MFKQKIQIISLIAALLYNYLYFATLICQYTVKDLDNCLYNILRVCAAFFKIYNSFSLVKNFLKYLPVYDSLTLQISSGVPCAIIVPPPSPPSGPRSIM